MFRTIELANVANQRERAITLDPKGPTHITAPSASGKSTTIHAILALLCGDAPNRTLTTAATKEATEAVITGTTAKGTVLTIRASKSRTAYSRTEGDGGPIQLGKEAYIGALGKWGGSDLRYIIAPMAWREIAGGTGEKLKEMLSRMLPTGDVPARVRELLGDDWRESDPCDVKGAAALQTETNRTKDRADATVDERRATLTRAIAARESVSVPTQQEIERAAKLTEAGEAWRVAERDGARWTGFDVDLDAWRKREPQAPAYDAQAHQAARVTVERLSAQAAAESAEEAARQAAEKAVEAERARAARDAKDRQVAAAVSEVADKLRPLIKPVDRVVVEPFLTRCPTCGSPGVKIPNPQTEQEGA